MTRNNHVWVKGDLTGDIYYDNFELNGAQMQYLRMCLMLKGVPGASSVKGLRVCVYGPLAELTYGHVRKGSRVGVIGHIQIRQTKTGNTVVEIVAEEVEYLRNIEWEAGARVRDDLVKRGQLRASYNGQDIGGGGVLEGAIPEDVLEAVYERAFA